MHSSALRSAFPRAVATLVMLFSSPLLRAEVQPLHWYRMGEDDNPPISAPFILPVLHDSIGNLDLQGSSPYGRAAFNTLNASYTSVVSRMCLASSGNWYETSALRDSEDFGFEIWVNAPPQTNGCIASNGIPGVNGWGIFVNNAGVYARVGSQTLRGISINGWTHVALVRAAGTTRLYVNGYPQESSTAAITTPTGKFMLGGTPAVGSSTPSNLFSGLLDEGRYFKITSEFDYRQDFLPSAPRISITDYSGPVITESQTIDLGDQVIGRDYPFRFHLEVGAAINAPLFTPHPLRISSAMLSGPDAGEFSLQLFDALPSTELLLSFDSNATTPGPKSATISIASNDPANGVFLLHLTANAVEPPKAGVFAASQQIDSNATVSFVPTLPGQSSGQPKTYTIRNTGDLPLPIRSLSLFGGNAADFTITQQPAASSLAPGESTTFTVDFSPSTPGEKIAVLQISMDTAKNFLLNLSGTAIGPVLALSGPDGADLKSHNISTWGTYQDPPDASIGSQAFSALAAGNNFTAGLQTDGSVQTWGLSRPDIPAGLTGVTAISAADYYLLALKGDGTVAAFGSGAPEIPAGLAGVTAISAGPGHAVALKNDGTVVDMGDAGLTAAVPSDLSGVVSIAAGQYRTLAIKSDGSVVEWHISPLPEFGLHLPADFGSVATIVVGLSNGLILRPDGSVALWKYDGSLQPSPFPASTSPVIAVALQSSNYCALRADGSIALATVGNSSGELNPPPGLRAARAIVAGIWGFTEIYDSLIDFSTSGSSSTDTTPRIFTLTNQGLAPLHLTGASLTGSTSYLIDDSAMAATLAPGASTTLSVALVPGSPGGNGTLEILSDDPTHPVFTVQLTTQPYALPNPYRDWKQQYFGSAAETGASADGADPNGNGIPNLLEYAFGGDPLSTSGSTAYLPKFSLNPDFGFTYHIQNNFTHNDLTLNFQGSNDLKNWVDLARSTDGRPFEILDPRIGQTGGTSDSNNPGIYSVTLLAVSGDAPRVSPFLFYRLQATRP